MVWHDIRKRVVSGDLRGLFGMRPLYSCPEGDTPDRGVGASMAYLRHIRNLMGTRKLVTSMDSS